MKRFVSLLLLALAFSAALSAKTPKYVFLFIGDGMGNNQVYLTGQYNSLSGNGGTVNFYGFPVRAMLSSWGADSLVPCSAATGTSLSSGVKVNKSTIGWTVDGKPTENICEIAHRNGWGTGFATSVAVNHATPACFYAHVPSRGQFLDIASQLFGSGIDFASGSTFLVDDGSDVKPSDLVRQAAVAGMETFCGRDLYRNVKGKRVLYLSDRLDEVSLPYAIDRKPGDMRLADFTAAGIEYLYSNFRSKGFFFMVEGGKIDYACHSNDASTVFAEVNDMAESVQLALEFAAKHPQETLILVTADHETGGMTITSGKYECHPERLAGQKCSKETLTLALHELERLTSGRPAWWQIKDVLRENLGLWDSIPVSSEQNMKFTQLYKEIYLDGDTEEEVNLYSSNSRIVAAAIKYLDSYAGLTWPVRSHSGAPLLLYAFGPAASEFAPCMDQTDVPACIMKTAKLK